MHLQLPWMLPVVVLTVDALMLLMVRHEYKNPLQGLNSLRGYRTSSSMQNPDTWREANAYSRRCLLVLVATTLAGQALAWPLFSLENALEFSLAYVCLGGLGIVLLTEIRLSKVFDQHGQRRNTQV